MRGPIKTLTLTLAVGGATLGVPAAAGAAPLEYGVVSQTVLTAGEFQRMERGGVETLRFLIRRRAIETAPGEYDWSTVDPVVGGAATHRIELLPILYGSPEWVHEVEAHPPIDTPVDRRGWKRFLTALVDRYGPRGEFWRGHPGRARPLRRWQLWNEGNFDFYWHPKPAAAEYARLVGISADAIRSADRRAEIVLGGVASVRSGLPWWEFIRDLYETPGIERDFDVVALHPYAPGIRLLGAQIRLIRETLREAGDGRTPLAITEIGWASDGNPKAPLVVGEARQARLLRRSFAYLAAHRRRWRISDVQWYAWRDSRAVEAFCSFCEHAGLFDLGGAPKPSWAAFRRAAR
jgi:polysaccharide biosynthesis protein PslG